MRRLLLALAACAPPAGGPGDAHAPAGEDTAADDGADTSPGGGEDTAGDTGEPPLPDFVLAVQVSRPAGGLLRVDTNLPRDPQVCAGLPVTGAPCADADADGLVDAWEAVALDRLRPVLRLDEDEPFVADADGVLGIVGRVAPVGDALRVFLMLGWSRDYGRCGVSAHAGDSERVVLAAAPEGEGGLVVTAAYTAAHEGELTDAGHVWTPEELGELVVEPDPDDGLPRWVVFPSEGKHASFGTVAACEGVSPIPCLDEDCDPDGVADLDLFDRLPPVVDAGEPGHPHLDELSALGFPDESAWADQPFCGGQGRQQGCASPVRDKLLVDPF